MKNSSDNSFFEWSLSRKFLVTILSMLTLIASQAPDSALAQAAGYYTQAGGFAQNGGVVWYGAQQHRVHQPAPGYYPAPGYIQIPAHSQPAVRGTYAPGSYAAAANAAAAHRYGGTTAWNQPGFVAQPYQQNSTFGVPQQHYGYYQAVPAYGHTHQHHPHYGQGYPYPGYGYPIPTGYPSHNPQIAGQPAYGQQGQGQRGQQPQPGQRQQPTRNQLTPVQQAARQAATNIAPNGAPVLSPAAQQFFQNLQGPNRTTFNQNRQNYSFYGQTMPSNRIPNTTWQSGSRFGQTWSHRNSHNQSTTNQNRFNYSLHNLTRPGLRGY